MSINIYYCFFALELNLVSVIKHDTNFLINIEIKHVISTLSKTFGTFPPDFPLTFDSFFMNFFDFFINIFHNFSLTFLISRWKTLPLLQVGTVTIWLHVSNTDKQIIYPTYRRELDRALQDIDAVGMGTGPILWYRTFRCHCIPNSWPIRDEKIVHLKYKIIEIRVNNFSMALQEENSTCNIICDIINTSMLP